MKFKKIALLLPVTVLFLFSCAKEESGAGDISLSVNPVSASVDAGEHQVAFQLSFTDDWKIGVTASWISLSAYYGAKTDTEITAKIAANTTENERTDTIRITCGNSTAKIPITQKGLGSIFPETDVIVDETASVSFKPFADWTLELTDTKAAPSWLEVSPTSGSAGTAELTITSLEDNISGQDRNALIKITIGSSLYYITVTQKPTDAILESKDRIEIGPEGGDESVIVTANMDYEVVISEPWISRIITKAPVERTENFSIAPNTNEEKREGMIIFKGSVKSDTVTVYQAQRDVLILSEDHLSFAYTGGTKSVSLRSNIEYDITIPESPEWLRIVTQSSARTDQFHIEADNNDGASVRNAIIIFKDLNSPLSDTLFITQGTYSDMAFLNETIYGLYGDSYSLQYTKGADQISLISYKDSKEFRILNYTGKKYSNLSNIPLTLKSGDSFDVHIHQNIISAINSTADITVTVLKTEDEKAWLYSDSLDLGFIIKK